MRTKLLFVILFITALVSFKFVHGTTQEEPKTLKIERIFATSTNLPLTSNSIFNCFDGDLTTSWSPMQGSGPNEGVMIYLSEPIWVRKVEMLDTEGKRMGGIRAYCDRGAWIDTYVNQLFIKIGPQYHTERVHIDSANGESRLAFDKTEIVKVGEIKIYGKDGKPLSIELPNQISAKVTSSSALKPKVAYGATNVIDNNKTTAWAEGVDGLGIGSKLTFQFDKPISTTQIKIWNGYQRSEKHFYANARAKSVQIIADGIVKGSFTLKDIMGAQSLNLSKVINEASKIELVVKSAYPGTAYKDLLISDVLFINDRTSISVSSKEDAQRISKNRSASHKLISKILDRNVNFTKGTSVTKGTIHNYSREERSILLRSNNTFVMYDSQYEGYENTGTPENNYNDEDYDESSSETIAEGSWTVQSQTPDKVVIKIFGRVYTPAMGPEVYVGDVKKNATLKIFKEFITITKTEMAGTKYVGSFDITHE